MQVIQGFGNLSISDFGVANELAIPEIVQSGKVAIDSPKFRFSRNVCVDDKIIYELSHKEMAHLAVEDASKITEWGGQKLRQISTLETLHLTGAMPKTLRAFFAVNAESRLKGLHIQAMYLLPTKCLQSAANFSKLHALSLKIQRVARFDGFGQLSQLKKLHFLNLEWEVETLSSAVICEEQIRPLIHCVALRTLVLKPCQSLFCRFPILSRLEVLEVTIIDAAGFCDCAPLKALKALRDLQIHIHPNDFDPLFYPVVMQTENWRKFSKHFVQPLLELKGLKKLALTNTVTTAQPLLDQIGQLREIEELNLSSSMPHESIAETLGALDIAPLGALTALSALNVSKCALSSLATLSFLRLLRVLNLFEIDYERPQSLLQILAHLTNLVDLNIGKCQELNDCTVLNLSQCSRLRVLRVYRCVNLTETGCQALKAILPELTIVH